MSDQLQAAFVKAAEYASERDDCLDPARLWEAVHGELDPGESGKIVDHIAVCPLCAESWRLANAIDGEVAGRENQTGEVVPLPVAQPQVPSAFFRQRAPMWGAVALAAVVLLVLGVSLIVGPEELPHEYREVLANDIVAVNGDGVGLSRDNALLVWAGGPEGATYDLTVSDEALNVVVRARHLTEKSYRIPTSAFEGYSSGDVLHWRVDAHHDGDVLASKTYSAVLK
ncbi:MAG: hypothetical protein HN348_13690 [Proteobacteria bacterium]|nr:hypothetical protein [Pseudomonadota bacterium]